MRFKHILMVAALCIALCGFQTKGGEVNVGDYLEKYTFGDDNTMAFRRAVEQARAQKAERLVIPEGTYHFYPELAFEKYAYVTNNSAGLKRFVFDLTDMENFTVEGNGSKFILHGFVSAFTIDSCSNVTIKDFTMDYARTFHSEGKVERVGEGWVDLRFPADYRYDIRNGNLYFSDERGNKYPFSHLLEMNSERREPEFMASDYWLTDNTIPAEKREDGTVRIFKDKLTAKVGNVLFLGPGHRLCPAIAIDESAGVNIHDVTIRHAGGMGVVAQHSRDIELLRVYIEPEEGSERMISITADATHFTHCEGYLRMIDCHFFNQIDDATNIHGMYGIVKQILEPNRILVFFPHEQQYGLDVLREGRTVEMLKQMSLTTYDEIKVEEVVRLNKEWYEVAFAKDIAEDAAVGDLITDISYPEVLIKGCRMGNNRARGLLLGSRKQTIIEDCYFHIPGSAIYFEGDGYYWYEQAGVRDVIIRNNTFDNCNYGYYRWGTACIAVGSGPKEDRQASRYNRNILIENNKFIISDPRIMNLYSVDGCTFRNNEIIKSDAYPYTLGETRAFVTDECLNIDIKTE